MTAARALKLVVRDEPAVLTLDEAAAFLRLCSHTVSKRARKGEIPGRRIGSTWRFLRTDLERYVHGDRPETPR